MLPVCPACFVQPEPAGNLLRRPAGPQPVHDVGQQVRVPRQLGQPAPPGKGLVLHRHRVVAGHVAPTVASGIRVAEAVAR